MKIITLTLNPALDITYTLDTPFEISGTHRPVSKTVKSGGKGINLSRALIEILNDENVMTAALAGADSENIGEFLKGCESLTPVIIARSEPFLSIRSCIKIKDSKSTLTELNESTKALTSEDVQRILTFVADLAASNLPSVLLLCGSAPEIEGMENSGVHIYSLICEIARYAGITCVADSSGRGLSSALNSGAGLIKPNLRELSELAGYQLDFHTTAIDYAKSLLREKDCEVLLTNGGEGAYFIGREGIFRAEVSSIAKNKNAGTVGMGDIMLAAFVSSYFSKNEKAELSLKKSSALAVYMANAYLSDDFELDKEKLEKYSDCVKVTKVS